MRCDRAMLLMLFGMGLVGSPSSLQAEDAGVQVVLQKAQSVAEVVFLPSSRQIVSLGSGTVQVWDIASGQNPTVRRENLENDFVVN